MHFVEAVGNIFELNHDFILVHCISSDIAMGAGVARTFNRTYKIKDRIQDEIGTGFAWFGKGFCYITDESDDCPWKVANLITKERYFNKPTYDTISEALNDLKIQLAEKYPDVKLIAMPHIGCGLDRLKWEQVSEMVKSKFEDTKYMIVAVKKG